MANVIIPTTDTENEKDDEVGLADQTATPVAETAGDVISVKTDSTPKVETASVPPATEALAVEAPATPTPPLAPSELDDSPLPGVVTSSDPSPAIAPVTPPVAATTPKRSSNGGSKHIGRLIFELLLVLIIAGLAAYCYTLRQDNSKLTKQVFVLSSSTAIVEQRNVQNLIKKVGALLTLPSNGEPAISDVTDATKAKAQSTFFNNAKNGDKLILYVKDGTATAVLYRPSTGKVINRGQMNITAMTPATPATTPKATQ